jgi:hypothetical protein
MLVVFVQVVQFTGDGQLDGLAVVFMEGHLIDDLSRGAAFSHFLLPEESFWMSQ